jgi:hypothetical protein
MIPTFEYTKGKKSQTLFFIGMVKGLASLLSLCFLKLTQFSDSQGAMILIPPGVICGDILSCCTGREGTTGF